MSHVIVFVENMGDEKVASVILAGQPVAYRNCSCESGTYLRAASSLERNPSQPVVVLLSAREAATEREIDAKRAAIHRAILEGGSTNYFFALAVPRVLDWALSDPRLRAASEASPPGAEVYNDRCLRVAELAKALPFDDSALRERDEDYRGLVAFVRRHAAAAAPSRAG